MSTLAPLVQSFFTERLGHQRRASPNTIAAYRDTFRLLFGFVADTTGKQPSELDVADLSGSMIGSFLDHLENDRHNSIRTRNARLSAIHSFFAYAALSEPARAADIQRVLYIPAKRFERVDICFLDKPEIEALLSHPDGSTWIGRRDHALLSLMVDTGLRVSEVVGLNCSDVVLGIGAHVRCLGKGRKRRSTPLTSAGTATMSEWLTEIGGAPGAPVFPARQGTRLGRHAIAVVVGRHVRGATASCPSLKAKRIGPHTLRHTCAMRLLQSGCDLATIALWLGHESIETTQIYLHADMALKERAIARTTPIGVAPGRYQPSDPLLAFLEAL
jgi:integrase/recombinase XerD